MMKMKQATMKKTFSRILPFVMTVILLLTALMPYASAVEYGIESYYYDLVTNRTGGTINSTMTWSGKSWSDCIDESAIYMMHKNILVFNGSDDPVVDGTSTVSMVLDDHTVTGSGILYNTEIMDNGDKVAHCYEKVTGCHMMHVTYTYIVENKDFVTKQEMDAYGKAVFQGIDELIERECEFD